MVFICIAIIITCVILTFVGIYLTRLSTVGSIKKLTGFSDGYDLYQIDIQYNYRLDSMLKIAR